MGRLRIGIHFNMTGIWVKHSQVVTSLAYLSQRASRLASSTPESLKKEKTRMIRPESYQSLQTYYMKEETRPDW